MATQTPSIPQLIESAYLQNDRNDRESGRVQVLDDFHHAGSLPTLAIESQYLDSYIASPSSGPLLRRGFPTEEVWTNHFWEGLEKLILGYLRVPGSYFLKGLRR